MTQEALKLSQEALAGLKDVEKQVRELVAENRALKEALAQTQEPVAKLKTSNMLLRCHRCGCSDKLNIQIEYTAPPQRTEQNFCPRCGKRTADLTTIHTCTPPQD